MVTEIRAIKKIDVKLTNERTDRNGQTIVTKLLEETTAMLYISTGIIHPKFHCLYDKHVSAMWQSLCVKIWQYIKIAKSQLLI